MENVRIRVNANGAFVMNGGKWIPADGRILSNCMEMMKKGLPDRPEFAV